MYEDSVYYIKKNLEHSCGEGQFKPVTDQLENSATINMQTMMDEVAFNKDHTQPVFVQLHQDVGLKGTRENGEILFSVVRRDSEEGKLFPFMDEFNPNTQPAVMHRRLR